MDNKAREHIVHHALCAYREECLDVANKIDANDGSYIRRFNRASRLQRAALADEALKPGGYVTGGQEMADHYARYMEMIRPQVEAEEAALEALNEGLAHDVFRDRCYGDAA